MRLCREDVSWMAWAPIRGSNWAIRRDSDVTPRFDVPFDLVEGVVDEGVKGNVACLAVFPGVSLTGANPNTVCFLATPLKAAQTSSLLTSKFGGTFLAFATRLSSSAGIHDMIPSRSSVLSSCANRVMGGEGEGSRVKGSSYPGGRDEVDEEEDVDTVDEAVEVVDPAETDRDVLGLSLGSSISGGGVLTTTPSSSTSRRPTWLAHKLSRIASARSGSAFSSSAERPVSSPDQGLFLASNDVFLLFND